MVLDTNLEGIIIIFPGLRIIKFRDIDRVDDPLNSLVCVVHLEVSTCYMLALIALLVFKCITNKPFWLLTF